MLVQLLDPTLFNSPEDMIKERHRLNAVVFRRTKADACRPDGSPLFARRWVHTESFVMCDAERAFYLDLNEYLRDGFALARRQGPSGTALGFVMTIFQKIAASSFAAVHRTLRRRLIALTVHEGLMHDDNRDIDQRDETFHEARGLIRNEFGLGEGRMDDLEVDAILADIKRRILKKLDEEALAVAADAFGDEVQVAAAEDSAVSAVALALPEERKRIKELLGKYPGRARNQGAEAANRARHAVATESDGARCRVCHVPRQRRDARAGKLSGLIRGKASWSSKAAITEARSLRRSDSRSPTARA